MKKLAIAASLIAAAAAFTLTAAAAIDPRTEIRPNAEAEPAIPGNHSPARVSSDHVPRPAGNALASSDAALNLAGLNFEEHRTADGGNQFSVEPPDQALCVGNGLILEAVNNVFRLRNATTGAPVGGIQAFNPFFTQDHALDRTTGEVGEDLGDPKCYYDPDLNRFFLTVLHLGVEPETGEHTGRAFVDIAVSKTGTPTTDRSGWFFYTLDVTNDGTAGTPSHPDCPCFGDQPLVGADRYGFYVSTNEFDLEPFGGSFNGAQIYAFDKAGLAAGAMRVQRIEGAPLASSYTTATDTPYSLQPASSPSVADWSSASNGTEYLLGALEFSKGNVTLDDRIAVWALTNTQSLTTATPNVQVDDVVVTTQVYGAPPEAIQKAGPTPLADAIPTDFVGKNGNGPKEHENLVNGFDDRMQDAVYAGGKLWGALSTVVKTQNGPATVGAAYFAFTPSVLAAEVSATVAGQGYVSVNGQSVLYPAIAMNGNGQGAIVFTLVGPDFFPSAAYARLSLAAGAASVRIAALGTRPADGFTGYRAFGGDGVERWGDYSDANVAADGSLWMATEWIQGNIVYPPRVANWNTRIVKITP
jgi:hypothetical protein